MLSSAQFEVLLLNGISVIRGLERATGVRLSEFDGETTWDSAGGKSQCWSVTRNSLGRIRLDRPVTILGWNWNLQRCGQRTRERIVEWAARRLQQSVTPERVHGSAADVDSDDRRDRELQDASWEILQLVKDASACLGQAIERLEILDPTPDDRRGVASVLEGHFNSVCAESQTPSNTKVRALRLVAKSRVGTDLA